MKEQARSNQQHATIPHDLAIVGLQGLYDQGYLHAIQQPKQKHSSLANKIGAWLLTIYDIGASWIGGYVLSASLLSWIPALLHPVFLITCIIAGVLQAALSLGSNIGDAQSSLGVWLFPPDKEVQDFKKRLEITKAAYEDLTDQIKSKKFSLAQLHVLLKLVKKNNEEIKTLYNKIQVRQKETIRYKMAKYTVLALSSTLHFGGGFILGKGLLGLIGLAFVPTPVTIAIGVMAGILALTSFLILKRHIILGNLNRLLRRPNNFGDGKNDIMGFLKCSNKIEKSLQLNISEERKNILSKDSIIVNKRLLSTNDNVRKLKQIKAKNKLKKYKFYRLSANDSFFFSRYQNKFVSKVESKFTMKKLNSI